MKDPYDDYHENPRGDSKQGRLEQELDALYVRNISAQLQELMRDSGSVSEAVSETLAGNEKLALDFLANPEDNAKRVASAAIFYLREIAQTTTPYPTEDDL